MSNYKDASFTSNTSDADNTNDIDPELDRRLTELELEIVNWEIAGTFLFILSSFYFLEASFIGQKILIDKLNNIEDNLDSTDLVDRGEVFSLEGLIIFTLIAFKRAEIERMRNNKNLRYFDEIANSYLVTLWAELLRQKDRAHMLGRIPDF